MIHTNKVFTRTLIASVSAILVACGGSSGSSSPAATTTSSSVISGTAAKGLLANAVVTAYCGTKAANPTPLKSTTTAADGTYSLTITQACSLPIEVVVTPSTTGTATTMLDEVTGVAVSVPATFALRAFAPSGSATVSLPVTPFTDMAAAVVEQSVTAGTAISSGVVTNANNAIIQTVLGGNAGVFTAVPLPPSSFATASADQQTLITYLSAISQLATTQTGATTGDKVQAALTLLATQAKQSVPAVTAANFTVSATASTTATSGATATPLASISAGLTALASSTSLPTSFPPAAQSNATALQTSAVQTASTQITNAQSSNGGVVTAPSTAVADGITAAKALLSGMKTNLQTFGNPQQTGFLQTKSTALTSDTTTVASGGTYHFLDIVKATQRATALLAETNRARATGTAVVNASSGTDVFGDYYQRSGSDGYLENWKCTAYYTAGSSLTANDSSVRTSPVAGNNGNPVAHCNYFVYGDGVRMMQFVVKSPAASNLVASGTALPYVNRIRVWANPACTSGSNPACLYTDTNQVTGTLTATWDSSSVLTGLTMVAAQVIPYIGTTATTVDLAYTGTVDNTNYVKTLNFSGTLTSGAVKHGFSSGSKLVITDTSAGAGTTGSVNATLIGRIATAGFQFDGTFTVNGTSTAPDQGTLGLTGTIGTLSGSTVTPFLEGTLNANGTTKTMAFTGKATNGTNVTSIALQGNSATLGQQTASITFLTGAYSFTASGTNYDNPATASTMDVTASDGSKVFVSRQNGTSTVVVKNAAGTQIGTMAGNQINFNDNTYIVLN